MELDWETFQQKAQNVSAVQVINLQESFPDYLKGGAKLSPNLEDIIGRTALSFLQADGGFFAFGEDLLLHVCFSPQMPEAQAKVKTDDLCALIAKGLEAGEAQITERTSAGGPKKNEDHTLSKIVQRGLSENPEDSELSMWAEREKQELYHMAKGDFIPKDILKMGVLYELDFFPVWLGAQEVVSGSFCHLLNAPAPKKATEKCRQDFALLSGGIIAVLKMLEKKQNGVVFIPLDLPLLKDEGLFEVYFGCMHKIGGVFKRAIGFEVRGIPSGGPSPKILEKLKEVGDNSKAMILHASVLLPEDYSSEGFKPFAYALDYASVKLSDEEVGKLLGKAVKKYHGWGAKTIVTNVRTAAQLEAAISSGSDFITGPAVGHQKKLPFPVQPWPRSQCAAS